jgi:AraC-like DNA-binding protein
MVCARCIEVIRSELSRAGFEVLSIQLGQFTIRGPQSMSNLAKVQTILTNQGFILIEEEKMTVHQRVKAYVNAYFSQDDVSENKTRLSAQLQESLGLDYDTLSGQFAKAEGITLEKYIILRRIDKVKEWLVYSDSSLTEIAYRTGYSSVQYLSNQFRQQTGLTPSFFRQVRQRKQEVKQNVQQSPG